MNAVLLVVLTVEVTVLLLMLDAIVGYAKCTFSNRMLPPSPRPRATHCSSSTAVTLLLLSSLRPLLPLRPLPVLLPLTQLLMILLILLLSRLIRLISLSINGGAFSSLITAGLISLSWNIASISMLACRSSRYTLPMKFKGIDN